MIGEKLIIHDKFSVEIKLSYEKHYKSKQNNFSIDLWFFIPNSLDINSTNYDKSKFYADLKTNLRLIKPVYSFSKLIEPENSPYSNLSYSIHKLLNIYNVNNENEVEYDIRMFVSIFTASFRGAVNDIINDTNDKEIRRKINLLLKNLDLILKSFRLLRIPICRLKTKELVLNAYTLGDEYISMLVEQNLFYLLESIKSNNKEIYVTDKNTILEYLVSLSKYKKKSSYKRINKNDKTGNLELIYKKGVLKKYFEGILFLSTRTTKDGVFITQILYGFSAAVAMIFATSSAFIFQQKYGNFSLPFFVALVIIYVFKDRIKDISNIYFKGKISKMFYDIKTSIKVKNNITIGWSKESFNFVNKNQVPKEVLNYRNKSRIVNVELRGSKEKIIYYRKTLKLKNLQFGKFYSKYKITGINDIIRFNIMRFVKKMDDPEIPLYIINDKEDAFEKIYGDKVYFMNIILRYKMNNSFEYSKYRLSFNRLGIKKIDKM